MTAAVEDRTVRRGLIAEDQLLRNVIGALRRALDDHPEGCLEASLWHGVEACFVHRVIFNEAVDIMVYAGWALRAGGRLQAGPRRRPHTQAPIAPATVRAGRRDPLFRVLSHRLGCATPAPRNDSIRMPAASISPSVITPSAGMYGLDPGKAARHNDDVDKQRVFIDVERGG